MDDARTPRGIAETRTVEFADRGIEPHDTIVVGGGQAGLTIGRELVRRDRDVLVLDAHARVGDAWRRRWDSLRLNTPAKYALPGRRLGSDPFAFVTKDEFADYLEEYAEAEGIPVRPRTRVARLEAGGRRYVVSAEDGRRFTADHVVIATGPFQVARRPGFAADLADGIVSVHSDDYRGPSQLPPGRVLVVGFGNSASEIALELSRTHETWISGAPSGELPFRHGRTGARFAFPVVRLIMTHVITRGWPVGRRIISKMEGRAELLIRVRRRDLAAAGVRMVPRTTGVRDGLPVVGDSVAEVASVVWCTGYREDYSWVGLPGFEGGVRPPNVRGVVETAPGVYLIGQHLLHAESSGTLPGIARDARWIARHLVAERVDGARRSASDRATGAAPAAVAG
ncbi:flavin-containing monooxygenase [Agromyces sp. SYSU T0242]|uniref:flavin-containing monooxygenase n=1 Tax=Agromyces litoreus TaxID=3158561 RepID=UPI0033949EDD